MLAGMQSPVGNPSGDKVASQPKSSRISAPCGVEETNPRTKKHVLRVEGERSSANGLGITNNVSILPSNRKHLRLLRNIQNLRYDLLFL